MLVDESEAALLIEVEVMLEVPVKQQPALGQGALPWPKAVPLPVR
ncbi:hypothetical protein ACIHFE_30415 [Streptomyces sp. NPDC052396]